MNRYLTNHVESDCCGCRACEQICPKKCITVSQNDEGFLRPVCDTSDCIDCGLCAKVCPMESECNTRMPEEIYGTASSHDETIRKSSSGGIFYLLARQIIEQGGYVVGAELSLEDRYLSHAIVSDFGDLIPLLGSKYICSDTNDTYSRTKGLLKDGHIVMYVGTPCQIAGLKLFLKKEYDNLLTVDLLCHGAPSQYVFKEYIGYLERKHHGKVSEICFRDKEKNGWSITLRYKIARKNKIKNYYEPAGLSPYFFGFLRGKFLRESCYHCPYTKLERTGDITLADFWGVQHAISGKDFSKGCSCVLLNTRKGGSYYHNVEEFLSFSERVTYEQAYKQNMNFYTPCKRPGDRDMAIADIKRRSFEYVAKTYCNNPSAYRIRAKMFIASLRSFFKRKN